MKKYLSKEESARIISLSASGMTVKQVAVETGVSRTTVYRVIDPDARERQNASARESKGRKRGVCVDCGGPTHYSGGSSGVTNGGVSPRCQKCGSVHQGIKIRGKGKNMSRVMDLLREKDLRYSEIMELTGLPKNFMGSLLIRLLRHGKIERVKRGVYGIPR